ncbi:MAG: hypothetical protein R3D32_05540 [Nitratireductor sp.]
MTILRDEQTPAEHRDDHRRMLRYMAVNAAGGVVIGLLVTAAIFGFNIATLGERVAHTANPVLPVFLVGAPLALLFGGAAAASSIILLPYRKRKSRP